MSYLTTRVILIFFISLLSGLRSVSTEFTQLNNQLSAIVKADDNQPKDLQVDEKEYHASVKRGQQIFHEMLYCGDCHLVNKQSNDYFSGPSLKGLSQRLTHQQIVESILQPSKKIADGYRNVNVVTIEGRVIQGIVNESKSNDSELYLDIDGTESTVSRMDIEEIIEAESDMPAGQTDGLTANQFADLIAFLKSL